MAAAQSLKDSSYITIPSNSECVKKYTLCPNFNLDDLFVVVRHWSLLMQLELASTTSIWEQEFQLKEDKKLGTSYSHG